jgi:hypothetical protein
LRRSIKHALVTTRACGRLADKDVVRVTAIARNRAVPTGERELRGRMIKLRPDPPVRCMAALANRRESGRLMRGRCGRVEGALMARYTGCGSPGIGTADVTRCTRHGQMFTRQGILRLCLMVKGGTLPRGPFRDTIRTSWETRHYGAVVSSLNSRFDGRTGSWCFSL